MDRKTRQRAAIQSVFEQEGRPLHPREVLQLANRRIPGVGLATIYRALKSLTEEGWLKTLEIPGNVSYFEVNRRHHHHHFRCRVCERVFDVEGCGLVNASTPPGFIVEDHEVLLKGRCGNCPSRNEKTSG